MLAMNFSKRRNPLWKVTERYEPRFRRVVSSKVSMTSEGSFFRLAAESRPYRPARFADRKWKEQQRRDRRP